MIKKTLLSLLLLFTTLFGGAERPLHSLHCSRELQTTLSTIQKLPEANTLIEHVRQEGPLRIEWNDSFTEQFEGYWSSEMRTVYVTKSYSEANLVTTVLFELHNASRTSDFEKIELLALKGKINRDQYIEKTEYIEYQNAKATEALIEQGIKKGLFDQNSRWRLPDTFKEHFACQKSMGHSAWIGMMYDELFNSAS